MPNGRSGSFEISGAQFRQLLQGLPGSTRVAGLPKTPGVTVSDLERTLDRYRGKNVFVEEQHHEFYLARLYEYADTEHLVAIDKASPLYEGFRRCHAEWLSRRTEPLPASKSKPWWKFW
jgi:hypothetical protein